ncbi:phosphatidylglycerol lysyltransferase domain-containing protein, partial [Staphylococcus aureus]|uniref:phosphatidylglycerol lysyltransferase domain-containing protein n=1 Tax=Staphylococcus aureus TaxID=1280 RepID=UPI0037D9F7CE
MIHLTQFSTSPKKPPPFTPTLNKFHELNISFQIIQPPFSTQFINQLQHLTHLSLHNPHQIHFSLPQFNQQYLSKPPIPLIPNQQNQLIPFSTLIPTYFNHPISLHLITSFPHLHLPLIHPLYFHILLSSKQQPYTKFNIPMATLSNLPQFHYSYLRQPLPPPLFQHFNPLYPFQP